MRNPNGYGSIKKLSGQRRRPFVFVVSEQGRQKAVEYFVSQVEAQIYQADYNSTHGLSRLSDQKMTFSELYHRWLPVHTDRTDPSASTITGYQVAYQHCQAVHLMPLSDIRYPHLQGIIDHMKRNGLSYSSCKKVRSLISLMYKYGQTMEYTDRSWRGLIHLGRNKPVRPHHPFSRQKINRLWRIWEDADSVLILLYTGMRISELLHTSKTDVNRRQRCIYVRRSKTQSGIRVIPIHDRIWPLIQRRLDMPGNYLICDVWGKPYTYSRYMTVWDEVMYRIRGEGHTPHDCRHTLATLLSNADVNEVAKRRILGHAGGDVTDAVYTHKNLQQLRKAIRRIH